MCLGTFSSFHYGLLINIEYLQMRKWLACATRPRSFDGAYDASQGLKPPFSPCNCNRHSVFFLVWLCMTRWFITNWAILHFFSLILSKLTLAIQNLRVVLLVIDISTSILFLLLFLFYFLAIL